MNLKTYYIPYSHSLLPLELPEHRVVFEADLPALEPMHDWKERLVQKLDAPTAGAPLCSLLSPKQHIVLLVEDNTRHTPVKEILPSCAIISARTAVRSPKLKFSSPPAHTAS